MTCVNAPAKKVLIFRVGSLGDTLVALPALRLVSRAFPTAKRRLLTNISAEAKAPPSRAVLAGLELIHGYIDYSRSRLGLGRLLGVAKEIRAWRPDVLVYLTPNKGLARSLRDAVYFRVICGVPKIVGVPVAGNLRRPRKLDGGRLYETQAALLLRRLSALGTADLRDPAIYSLALSGRERAVAQEAVDGLPVGRPLIAASVGTKFDTNDWGDARWRGLLSALSRRLTGWSLVMVGAEAEAQRTAGLLKSWRNPAANLCGKLSVRRSAAVIERAKVFVGHDSGPMHLAAAVGTPCAAIFSARTKPGEWFPLGEGHRPLYHQVPCYGCGLDVCVKYDKKCIRSITVEEVLAAVEEIVGAVT